MNEQKQYLWEKIIEILSENPDVFPITKFIIDSNKENNISAGWVKYQLETFCGIQITFEKYYEALSLFWYISDSHFKETFDKNVISNVLFHYKDISFSNKEVDEKFKEIIDSL